MHIIVSTLALLIAAGALLVASGVVDVGRVTLADEHDAQTQQVSEDNFQHGIGYYYHDEGRYHSLLSRARFRGDMNGGWSKDRFSQYATPYASQITRDFRLYTYGLDFSAMTGAVPLHTLYITICLYHMGIEAGYDFLQMTPSIVPLHSGSTTIPVYEILILDHLRDLMDQGAYLALGVSETPSERYCRRGYLFKIKDEAT